MSCCLACVLWVLFVCYQGWLLHELARHLPLRVKKDGLAAVPPAHFLLSYLLLRRLSTSSGFSCFYPGHRGEMRDKQLFVGIGGLPVALFGSIATFMTHSLRHLPIDSKVVVLELHRRGCYDHL